MSDRNLGNVLTSSILPLCDREYPRCEFDVPVLCSFLILTRRLVAGGQSKKLQLSQAFQTSGSVAVIGRLSELPLFVLIRSSSLPVIFLGAISSRVQTDPSCPSNQVEPHMMESVQLGQSDYQHDIANKNGSLIVSVVLVSTFHKRRGFLVQLIVLSCGFSATNASSSVPYHASIGAQLPFS